METYYDLMTPLDEYISNLCDLQTKKFEILPNGMFKIKFDENVFFIVKSLKLLSFRNNTYEHNTLYLIQFEYENDIIKTNIKYIFTTLSEQLYSHSIYRKMFTNLNIGDVLHKTKYERLFKHYGSTTNEIKTLNIAINGNSRYLYIKMFDKKQMYKSISSEISHLKQDYKYDIAFRLESIVFNHENINVSFQPVQLAIGQRATKRIVIPQPKEYNTFEELLEDFVKRKKVTTEFEQNDDDSDFSDYEIVDTLGKII